MGQRTSNQIFSLRYFSYLVAVSHLRVPAVHALQYNRNCAVFGVSTINWTNSPGWCLLHCVMLLRVCGRIRDRRLPGNIDCLTRNKMDDWFA